MDPFPQYQADYLPTVNCTAVSVSKLGLKAVKVANVKVFSECAP